jgi:hypothetical protein
MGIESRGFASMSKAKQRKIARLGGRTAHAQGVAHQWTQDEARLAGQKGGFASAESRRRLRQDGRSGVKGLTSPFRVAAADKKTRAEKVLRQGATRMPIATRPQAGPGPFDPRTTRRLSRFPRPAPTRST